MTTTPQPPALMRPTELAARWACSVQTLNNQRCAGVGPPYLKLGDKTVRYRREDIEAYEAARLVKTLEAA